MYVYCSNGDHLITRKKEPVDSPAAVEAMLEWMSSSYDVKRMYWRGAGEQLWDMSMKYGKETANIYDWVQWRRQTFQQGTTQAAVSAAKKFGMDIFMYTSLFDYGVQPDIGIIGPYLFEDRKRIERPDWCMIDRWGERRCPGPYEFAYPEARQFVIRRFVDYVTEHHFDGINFYTYVENCGMRYVDEFGFSEPVVQLFRERYPDTDLRRDRLTEEQKRHWYACRGTFVTDFVRELHAELAVRGKKLSIILDANDPDYTQPWWSRSVPGMGFIRMDWQQWVKEGIVDELWVQLDAVASQTATLDRLLGICSGTAVKLTFRTPNPFDPVWEPYREAGVTPVTVITSPVNGIERLSATLPTSDHLASGSWIERAQSLADMADGR
ncbi:MAG: lyase domain protein repeat-containing protein, partial [Paenibacillus sp.]|nr:lyase domain protein repeat-containing protein [Paenibacillus sp.]